ncbi:hypothetical protein [Hydrogenophaga sp. BPS33]|uniref:hypothetical protein n=1 Tax=Hydrogenophaga sp. BPS33 TaxID=2651974 RepID=UPI00131F7256|nr:hypothetical protein [Hydrogenophaga sp. BPS33]QHE86507.1 hypothetical protein F9K07_17170 [Hydrogenophaga sp. BPS33]
MIKTNDFKSILANKWKDFLTMFDGRGLEAAVFAVLLAGVIIIGAYVLNFAFEPDTVLSKDPGKWGSFGDYVGGLLNPIVALAALGLLAYSVRIQRQELAATRKALRDQADHSRDMVRLNAMVTVIDAHERQIAQLRAAGQRVRETRHQVDPEADAISENLREKLDREVKGRDKWLREVESLLKSSSIQDIAREYARRFGL